ncbi:hypothetical protein B0T25DRAFT_633528 [Lasiosphaeria hispida]|uniref:Uncharacterized protein n=1 Tax=Lasiosphaeria hispida TaxID=260671 RepID=A0AAJ0MA27_9PEZI|nr:hypothetical protein B0T25DRAFT_633528 [Lasiosphaeria hispida]
MVAIGGALGRSENDFRFFSRASPILCVADVLHFLVLLVLGFSFRPRQANIKYELRRRFEGVSQVDLTNAENNRISRWGLMVLGGIPCQTIKLMAMEGVLWTKTARKDMGSDTDLALHVPFICHSHLAYSAVATVTYWLLFTVSPIEFEVAAFICLAIAAAMGAITIAQLLLSQQPKGPSRLL